MENLKTNYLYYKYLLSYFFLRVKEVFKKAKKFTKLRNSLWYDLENVRINIINNQHIEDYVKLTKETIYNTFSESVIYNLRMEDLFKSLSKIEVDKNYKKMVNLTFSQYYKNLDKYVEDVMEKIYKESVIHNIENSEDSEMDLTDYRKEKLELQIEMVKLQEWVRRNKKRVVVVFEGRDAAGKGSSIKRFTEHLNPKYYRIIALGIPNKEESDNWFGRYESHLPNNGEIVFFDRSWYNRAVIEPTMGYCTEKQYTEFMENVNEWERNLIESGITLVKFWFSIKKEKQSERFQNRKNSPLKYWKYSENDKKSLSKWDLITKYKNQMFQKTSTDISPWVIINSNDKKVARLNSMRYLISKIPYLNKDYSKNLTINKNIVKIYK